MTSQTISIEYQAYADIMDVFLTPVLDSRGVMDSREPSDYLYSSSGLYVMPSLSETVDYIRTDFGNFGAESVTNYEVSESSETISTDLTSAYDDYLDYDKNSSYQPSRLGALVVPSTGYLVLASATLVYPAMSTTLGLNETVANLTVSPTTAYNQTVTEDWLEETGISTSAKIGIACGVIGAVLFLGM